MFTPNTVVYINIIVTGDRLQAIGKLNAKYLFECIMYKEIVEYGVVRVIRQSLYNL